MGSPLYFIKGSHGLLALENQRKLDPFLIRGGVGCFFLGVVRERGCGEELLPFLYLSPSLIPREETLSPPP
jgi:hypothetical protein